MLLLKGYFVGFILLLFLAIINVVWSYWSL